MTSKVKSLSRVNMRIFCRKDLIRNLVQLELLQVKLSRQWVNHRHSIKVGIYHKVIYPVVIEALNL